MPLPKPAPQHLLVLNSGSSSLKFALYGSDDEATAVPAMTGQLSRIGLAEGRFESTVGAEPPQSHALPLPDHAAALAALFGWLAGQPALPIGAVGHRVVHGGPRYTAPQLISPPVLADLRALIPLAPNHLPAEISLIEAVSRRFPALPQVACFDTAFHRTLPARARRLPLPRSLAAAGLVRYGFHGLSYEYVLGELARQAGPVAAGGRVVLAHLGNGASMAAVRGGQSRETTMGFTPAGGLMMGTRPGDLDPGVLLYLLENQKLDTVGLNKLFNHESGLLGVSGLSSDVAELLAQAPEQPAAAEAIELFCYLARKQLGGLVAVLNGLDTLVFTGGIGANSPAIRAAICADFDFLGLALDAGRNAANAPIISPDGPGPVVRVIPTNEEQLIARHTRQVLLAIPH